MTFKITFFTKIAGGKRIQAKLWASILTKIVKNCLKYDLVMQSRFLSPKLCLFYVRFPLHCSWKNEQSRLWENIKDPALRTNLCWAHMSIKPPPVHLTEGWFFCLQMTSVIKRSPIYLQVVLKITIKAWFAGCCCSVYWSLSRWDWGKGKDKQKEKKNRNFLLNLISDNPILEVY